MMSVLFVVGCSFIGGYAGYRILDKKGRTEVDRFLSMILKKKFNLNSEETINIKSSQ